MADILSVIADVLKQDKQQKREQAKMMKEVQKKLKEKGSEDVAEEPGDKEDYMKFFAGKLKKYGAKSPSELSDEDKKKFFNEIEKDWKHDSSEEVEVEEKEEDLGKRVKSRMEAEDDDEEDEDEAPVGDQDEPETEPEEEESEDEEPEEEESEDEVDMDDPSEDQIDKIADLVVQKLKDKADDEEEEEQEPDSTEAEGGKEEEIDTEPKVENMHRNPHRKNVWVEALKKVNENVRLTEKGTAYPATIDTLKMIVREKQNQTVMFKSGQAIVDIFTASAMVAVYDAMKPATKKKFEEMIKDKGGFMKTQAFAMKMTEDAKWIDQIKEDPSILETFVITEKGGSDWLEDEMDDVQHKWKNTKIGIKVQWLSKIHSKASKEGMDTAELEDRLDDFGLTKFPKEKVWDEARKVKSKWKRMSTSAKTKWLDKLDDIAKKANTSDADVEAIRDEFGLHMKEEVEVDENFAVLNEALKPRDKAVIDAFYSRKGNLASNLLSVEGGKLTKMGMGGQEIAIWKNDKIVINAKMDVKSTEEIVRYMKKSIPSGVFEEVELDEGNVKPIESAIKKSVKGWKKMSKSDKTKFKSEMKKLASKNGVSNSDLEEILDDYGLTEQKESIGMSFLRKHYSKDKQ